MRWLGATAVLVCSLLTYAGLAVAPAAAETIEVPPLLRPPEPHFTWSLPDRYEAGWAAWNDATAQYDPAYVDPDGHWRLKVDACASSNHGRPIDAYEVSVRGVGFAYGTALTGAQCRKSFTHLPRLGYYDVSLILDADGSRTPPLNERILVKDDLIVSAGDSMASGEGNPDLQGRYQVSRLPKSAAGLKGLFTDRPGYAVRRRLRREQWRDRRCHRSGRAGHALIPRAVEDRSPHSTVTYLSLACSGAEVTSGMLEGYTGQELRDRPLLAAQVDVLERLVGTRGSGRRIDALLLSIGINDLGFSDIVEACATNVDLGPGGDPDCVNDSGVRARIGQSGDEGLLGERYDRLGAALRSLDAPEVYITDYPRDPFGDHACGLLGLKWYGQTSTIGITDREAQAMDDVGGAFGAAIRRGAERNGWNYVEGMSAAFKGHDYCEDDRYLVQLEESLRRQGNKYGSVHPNRVGHQVLGRLLLDSMVLGRPDTPYYRTRFAVERVRVGTVARDTPAPVLVRVLRFQTDVTGIERRITVPGRGEWFDVPAGALAFDLTLRSPPRPPRHATSIRFLVRSSSDLPGELTYAQGFGAGVHVFEHPPQVEANRRIAIQYRVTVQRVPPQVAPTP